MDDELENYPRESIEVNDGNFIELLEKYPLLVVDCWASWCMPCKLVEPVIEELAGEYAGRVVFGKLNVDENRELAMKFGIMSIPTLLFFKEKQAVDTVIGAVPKEHIEAKIQSYL